MTPSQPFDWNQWYSQFSLPPQALAEFREIYPRIVASRQVAQSADDTADPLPLSDKVVAILLGPRSGVSDAENLFEHYLGIGEIAAATALLELVAASSTASTAALQHRVSQHQQEYELQFTQYRAQLDHLRRTLSALGVIPQSSLQLDHSLRQGETLYRQQRLGPAVRILRREMRNLAHSYAEHRKQLVQRLDHIRTQMPAEEAPDVRAALRRLAVRAALQLREERLAGADSALRAAELLQHTRDVAHLHNEDQHRETLIVRDNFPDLRASEIIEGFEGDAPNGQRLKQFAEDWCPPDWQNGQRPARQSDPTYPIYEAVKDLAQLSAPRCPYPFAARRSSDPWSTFLKDLFDLIGKRGLGPSRAEALATRSLQSGQTGYWLSYCDPGLTVPFSFLDPARLPEGLPVILWHRPNDPLCPKPANVHNEVSAKKGLNLRPILVIAGDEIAPEDREALYRALPTAALLDEHDLLQIIFCSDQPEIRAMHFARAIAGQLPASLSSPYSEQGDVASALFVGRQDVLREFLDPAGPTVLYGGRKLGKSSVFRQIERMFVGQGEKRVAIYFNAVNIVDDIGIQRSMITQLAVELNQRIKGDFAQVDEGQGELRLPMVYSKNRDMCEEFALSVRRLLSMLPEHRFLLLIDEADSLLQHLDTPNNALNSSAKRFGWTLRGLVQDSGGRFDVRFAGFQEISRAAQSPSGPFYNFRQGTPQLALSVLNRQEARDLILNPLQILRAALADESLVEFILDVTGHHPALIQAFCGRLYRRVRGTKRNQRIVLNASDVEASWQDPQFRKDVIRAIHLNVETRNTRAEKTLRLVLYLWVIEIMAPSGRTPLPLICEPIHLYQLLCDAFGKEIVERQIRLVDLGHYLADLETLGVLARIGRGYVFRYRYFANLLYYDHFGGQLGDMVIRELWTDIIQHSDLPPRFQIQIDNQLSVSPFTREEQSSLEQERQRVILALGAPGTGKTEFFRWLETHREQQKIQAETVQMVDVEGKRIEEIRDMLARILQIKPEPVSWQEFFDRTRALCRDIKRPTLIVLDSVDTLAHPTSGALIDWPAYDRVEGYDGLLHALASITEYAHGQLRFILSGSFPLTRLWVEWKDLISDVARIVVTKPLTVRTERDAWFEAARLYASPDLKERIWRFTNGDWRMLTALRFHLQQNNEEMDLNERHIQTFQQALQQPDSPSRMLIDRVIAAYDLRARSVLQALAQVAHELPADAEADEKFWSDLVAEALQQKSGSLSGWSSRDVQIDLSSAILLQELESVLHGETSIVRLPRESFWFQQLSQSHV